jgi:transposase InsO family protein
MLAKKKKADGTIAYRFCVDLKQINSITNKDSYSLPRISETVDALSGAKFFTTIDIDRAFWQVRVAEEDKEKTAFVMDGKLFEFNVMPFGSMNASSTFQRLMDRVLRGLTWKQCLVYVDDVLIFSSTFEKHLLDIDEVLSRFKFAGLKLKPTKCTFADNEVEYLGFKITDKGLAASNSKVEAIMKITPPATTKNLFSFLCSVNYYRTLIPNYGRITSELYKMCEGKSRHCQWSSSLLKSFTDLKQALISAPILAFPNFKLPFHIQTDASNNAIGAVLLQKADEFFKPIAFASRKLSETEKRYSATERELLALVYAYDQFYSHVYGRQITFYTDHEPLSTMNRLKNPLGRLGRLFHRLQDVIYQIFYVPGPENFLPDFLSRSFEPEIEINNIELKSSIDWITEQANDEEISQIIKVIQSNSDDTEWLKVKNGSRWIREKRELYLSEGVLKHSNDKLVCPQRLKTSILQNYHDSPFGGHRAYETTLISIRNRYYWNYMPSEVKNYCQSCSSCQMFNYACLHNVAPLKQIQVSRPWQLVGVDFMGVFKTSRHGNKYIILAIDHFTKYLEGAATPTFDATTTALFLFNNIICRYGMMEKLLADQGVNFESNLLKQLCILLGTDKLHTSTYHAAGNGITERVNKVVKPNIAKYVNDDHDDWDLFLQMAISAYNNSYHSTIKMTPYEAQFGRKPVIVAEVIMNNQLPADTRIKDISEFTVALRRSAEYISEIIRENTINAQAKQKFFYDRFVKDRAQFHVGDITGYA